MSGHSKWHSIKHKKGAADAKRGKVFTQHAKMIALAAQNGGDPDMNPSLRAAIDRAKMDNLPNNNIDRAIKKGTGELNDGAIFLELTYEGYGPGGVAIYVNCITDNKNRTVSSVRSGFSKHGGNMGENGCVAWMFKKKGLIGLNIEGMDAETVEMAVIEAGAEDMEANGDMMSVTTSFEDLMNVKKSLEEQEMKVENAEIAYIANDTVKIEDEGTAKKILRLMEALEENEDVTNVSSNFDISMELMEAIAA
jgi:YebC/PmpR family DNA-binding regulatory protein